MKRSGAQLITTYEALSNKSNDITYSIDMTDVL